MLIHHLIEKHAGTDLADKVCLIYGSVRLTYGEFNYQIDSLARRLARQIKQGDRVLVKLAHPVAQLQYFFAIIKAGGVSVLVDAETSPEVAAELMRVHQLNLTIDDHFNPAAESVPDLPDIEEKDIFFGALSSGTTGIPKVIWRDHPSWCSAFPAQSQVFTICQTDRIYLAGSLAYTANLNSCLHLFSEGGSVSIASGSMPRTWVKELTDCQATAIFMVPANYRRLLQMVDSPITAVKSLISCGAKLDCQTARKLQQYFPQAGIVEYYGASELGHVSYLTANELFSHPGSVGRAFPGVTIRIEDQSIWVTSPYLAPGFRPKASVGDLGRIDASGYVYLLGRKQGVINTGGVKVIPEQVEDILRQCPGVEEAAVSAIDDPIRGQKVCAWLVSKQASLRVADVLAFCRTKMLKSCCPQQIIFVAALPLTASGKVDKKRLLVSTEKGR